MRSRDTTPDLIRRYGVAVIVIVLAAVARLLLDPLLNDRMSLATVFLAVAFMAWYGGSGPAWFTLVLGTLVISFLIIPPRNSFAIERPEELVSIAFYVAISMGTILVFSQLWNARLRAEANAARFRQLADAMPQIVWTALPDGNIDYQNRRWSEFSGLREGAGNAAWADVLHPEDWSVAHDRWAESVRDGSAFDMEIRLLDRTTQAYRWHLFRTVPANDEHGKVQRWFGTATDIHEQKRAAEASRFLAEASAELSGVVDYESTLQKVANLAVPYFSDWSAVEMVNANGTLRSLAVAHRDPAKLAFVQQLQQEYPADPSSPTGAYAVLRSAQPRMIGDIPDEMLVQAAKDARHLKLIRSLGLRSYLCVPLVVSGKPVGVFTFATAESGRLYTESDLVLAMDLASRASVAIENAQLYQALRESDRRKDEFLATLAHELRNPLAPISNALQIMKMPRIDAEIIERSRNMMERQLNLLVRLVDDLLDVSRVTAGKIELHMERVDLASVVARALDTVQVLIDSHGHEVIVQMPDEALTVNADPLRLSQVVANILTNAAKYSEDRGHILIGAQREGDVAVLRIRDHGIGIAAPMLARIFQLFVQADHSSTKAHGGLGIGLTLAKNLVEMHGGSIEARSEGLGKGSEFVVRLPLAQRDTANNDAAASAGSLSARASQPLRLLVIDDNKDAALSLQLLLKLHGHDVCTAHSGASALELTRSFIPNAVFLDIGMPDMDGYEVARRLRQQPGLEKVVLVAVSGWGQQDDRRRTSEAGFDAHLVKPPQLAAIEDVLARVL